MSHLILALAEEIGDSVLGFAALTIDGGTVFGSAIVLGRVLFGLANFSI